MALDIHLVVTDASPLITLAAAGSLDFLLYPTLPVLIPDAVFHEAMAAAGKLGAQEIIDWYRAHTDLVRIEPTAIFQDIVARAKEPGSRIPRDLGERAALEVVRDTALLRLPDDRALLLTDDRDAERLIVTDPARIILLTTWDFLRQLEVARRIQSAEAVIDAVRRTGRNPVIRDLWSGHDPDVKDAVQAILQAAHERKPR
jgi:hypothetical protein